MQALLRGTVPRNFERRQIASRGKNAIWEVDLIDFGAGIDHHRGFIIVAIDQYDRRGFLEPLNSKSAAALRTGLGKIFARAGGSPDEILADKEAGLASISDTEGIPHVFSTGRHANLAEGMVKWTRHHLEPLRDNEVGRGWRHLIPGLEKEWNEHKVHMRNGPTYEAGNAAAHILDAHYAEAELKNFKLKIPFGLYDLVLLPNSLGDREINFKAFDRNWSPQPYMVVLILHNNLLSLAEAKLNTHGDIVPGTHRQGSVYPEQCKRVSREIATEYLSRGVPPRTPANDEGYNRTSIIQTRRQKGLEQGVGGTPT